jgi:hypothetical protein
MAGDGSLLTATDTQETYTNGGKVDSGKIISAWRPDPLGAINVAGTGDTPYINALSQEIVKQFQAFHGTADELDSRVRHIVEEFYRVHILPLVGKLDDANVPEASLLIAARHEGTGKLWTTERTLVTEATPFDCLGIGAATANALLNRLYPLYPTLDSVAILAAYVIYRVKSSVDGCGLKTEIRFIHRDRPGAVPFSLIDEWENLFRKYDRLEREVFYHAMNFVIRPPAPMMGLEGALPLQMKPLSEIVKEIEQMREDFAKLPIFKSLGPQVPEKEIC